MSICVLSGGEFGCYLFGMYFWSRLPSPSAEVVGETCESIKVKVCGNCNRGDLQVVFQCLGLYALGLQMPYQLLM